MVFPMRLTVDAILFDIDETLVDSTAAVTRSWTTWAAIRGLDAAETLACAQLLQHTARRPYGVSRTNTP